jgi:hypothetical protein
MPHRGLQIIFMTALLWLSWLLMTLIHEAGHVIGALCTGGTIRRVIWHPAVLSRTDVHPNPHPVAEVWAGPLIGVMAPLLLAGLAQMFRLRIAFIGWFIAGFCLIANGAYIGIGAIHPIGDAQELVRFGMPRWSLATFGIAAGLSGLWIWHLISPRLGFGNHPREIERRDAYWTLIAAASATLIGIILGNRGL